MVEYQKYGQSEVDDGQQQVPVQNELLSSEFGQDRHGEDVAYKLHPSHDQSGVHANGGQNLTDDGVGLGDYSTDSCHLHHEGKFVPQQNSFLAVLNFVFLVYLTLRLLLHPLALCCDLHQLLVVYVLDVIGNDEHGNYLSGLVVFVLPDKRFGALGDEVDNQKNHQENVEAASPAQLHPCEYNR